MDDLMEALAFNMCFHTGITFLSSLALPLNHSGLLPSMGSNAKRNIQWANSYEAGNDKCDSDDQQSNPQRSGNNVRIIKRSDSDSHHDPNGSVNFSHVCFHKAQFLIKHTRDTCECQ
jgi:hypothetical protein